MTEWSVEMVAVKPVGYETTAPLNLDEAMYDALAEISPERGAVGSVGEDRYSMRMSVEGEDFVPAIETALGVFQKVTEYAGLPRWPILHAAATEVVELDWELEFSNYPGLLGVTELAQLLDVSKQRASELARSERFPKPFVELASGPVWLDTTVRRFVDEWDRRPGRPRKVLTPDEVEAIDSASKHAQQWDKEVPIVKGTHPGYPG